MAKTTSIKEQKEQEKRGKQQQPEQDKIQARATSTARETALASAKVTPRRQNRDRIEKQEQS